MFEVEENICAFLLGRRPSAGMNVCLLLAHQLWLSLLVLEQSGDIQKYFSFLLWSRAGIHRYVCTTIMEPGRDIQKSSDLSVLIEGAGIFRYHVLNLGRGSNNQNGNLRWYLPLGVRPPPTVLWTEDNFVFSQI